MVTPSNHAATRRWTRVPCTEETGTSSEVSSFRSSVVASGPGARTFRSKTGRGTAPDDDVP